MFDEILWKITSVILIIFLLIIFPLLHMYEKQDQVIYYRVMDDLDRFVDEIKSSGEISPVSWLNFEQKVNSYGYNFEIKITHDELEYVPIYEDPTLFSTFSGKMQEIHISNSDKEIKKILFPMNSNLGKTDIARKYIMKHGDYIIVEIKCTHRSKADILRGILLQSAGENAFNLRMSAMVAN